MITQPTPFILSFLLLFLAAVLANPFDKERSGTARNGALALCACALVLIGAGIYQNFIAAQLGRW